MSVLSLRSSGESDFDDSPNSDLESDESTSQRRVRVVAVALLIFFVFLISPNSDGGDGYLVIPTAYSIVHDRDLDLSEFHEAEWYDRHYAISELNGRTVNYFPWLTSVFAIPVVVTFDALHQVGLAGDQLTAIRDQHFGYSKRLAAAAVSTLAAVALALVARRLLRMFEVAQPVDASGVTAWLRSDGEGTFEIFAVIMALGTSLWSTASRSMWQHGPSVLVGAIGVLGLLRLVDIDYDAWRERSGPRRSGFLLAATGAALSLSYWIRPTNAVLTLVAVGVLWFCRRRALAPVLAASAMTHVAMLALNFLLLGTVLPPYFRASRFEIHDQYLQAVAGNLVSPARGLFVFSPFLLGAVLVAMPSRWRRLCTQLRSFVLVAFAGSLAYLLVVSGFAEKWWAGLSYGPRFMTESLVLLAPLALVGIFGPRLTRRSAPAPNRPRPALAGLVVAVAAIGFSFVTHASGAALSGVMCWNDRGRDNYPARAWDWSDPQFLEGPDLLIGEGTSGAMNPDCPKT